MDAVWSAASPVGQLGTADKPLAPRRVASRTSVLESSLSFADSETGSPAQSPHGSPGVPLLETVMATVCSSVRCGGMLPQATLAMVHALFPSATAISATVPSADGLGVTVVKLVEAQRQQHGGDGAPGVQLAQPLVAGGVLSFGLAAQPPPTEQQLMQAFAAELSSRLDMLQVQDPLACAAGPGPPMPHDCFWMSC